jgi:hypothetical protein
VEYLAAYEKTWLLESFHTLDRNVLAAQGKVVDWLFLDVHATGEPEHAELGHASVAALVPASHTDVLRECVCLPHAPPARMESCIAREGVPWGRSCGQGVPLLVLCGCVVVSEGYGPAVRV